MAFDANCVYSAWLYYVLMTNAPVCLWPSLEVHDSVTINNLDLCLPIHIYFAILISYTFILQGLILIEIMFVWNLSLRRVDDTKNMHVTIRRTICVIEPMSMCRHFELWIGLWSGDLTRLMFVVCVISGVCSLHTHQTSFVLSLRCCVERSGGWNIGGNWCGNVYDIIYDNVFCNCCAKFCLSEWNILEMNICFYHNHKLPSMTWVVWWCEIHPVEFVTITIARQAPSTVVM